ncbi:ulp1 protease family catalytic domain, Homeodomain-like protein [Artemisia annua]|uniref:Ulp1 protease family catalytic domain, Homeodomain-like protein n=1 Tax=Artemisia annua TaxID=35608 RepID=A0A2U1MVI1_ARTAN|nr:ulp1 protease family catalytic domain, Homeodomain-like protein [Artemisia annua]
MSDNKQRVRARSLSYQNDGHSFGLVFSVPQQRDNEESEFYALYYIKLFIETAPKSFSPSGGYPYFMKKDWFNSEGLESFHKALESLFG